MGEGVAEDIITALSRFPDLVVVARSSSFTYKDKALDVRQVGKELGVDYVVEGSVHQCPLMTQSGHWGVARCWLMSVHLNC